MDKSSEECAVSVLQQCFSNLRTWMDENRLKLNVDKTETIITGSRQQLLKCDKQSIGLGDQDIVISDCIKYLGVLLDSKVSLKKQIQSKCKTAVFNLLRIKQIRHLLTEDACHSLVRGLVLSHLDYCNAIYAGLPNVELDKLQRVQNMAARLVRGVNKYDSATECRKYLHWLPIRERIKYKVLCLVFNSIMGKCPSYLQNLLTLAPIRRAGLRSSKEHKRLLVPFTKLKTFAARSFSCIGPYWWNQLPNYIKEQSDIVLFKSKLKTYLFRQCYD